MDDWINPFCSFLENKKYVLKPKTILILKSMFLGGNFLFLYLCIEEKKIFLKNAMIANVKVNGVVVSQKLLFLQN